MTTTDNMAKWRRTQARQKRRRILAIGILCIVLLLLSLPPPREPQRPSAI